jgi:hypothetical protein
VRQGVSAEKKCDREFLQEKMCGREFLLEKMCG